MREAKLYVHADAAHVLVVCVLRVIYYDCTVIDNRRSSGGGHKERSRVD